MASAEGQVQNLKYEATFPLAPLARIEAASVSSLERWASVARRAAAAAATGSMAARSSVRAPSLGPRGSAWSCHRTIWGARADQFSRGRTTMPTRRRETTTPRDSRVRTQSRARVRETL